VFHEFARGIDKGVFLWAESRDVRHHPFDLLNYVFIHLDASVALYLEDDVIISPDATKLAEWYVANASEFASLHFNHGSQSNNAEEDPVLLIPQTRFISTLGVVFLRTHWLSRLRQWYFNDDHKYAPSKGWDYSLAAYTEALHIPTLYSAVARANHIGHEGGTHANPEWSKAAFEGRKIYTGPAIHAFHISDCLDYTAPRSASSGQ
jgi:hypothetical protein